MNKSQINEKIKQIEQKIHHTKASLKSWANLIGKYHTQLKEFTDQLATLKKQLTMKENNINNQGGKK